MNGEVWQVRFSKAVFISYVDHINNQVASNTASLRTISSGKPVHQVTVRGLRVINNVPNNSLYPTNPLTCMDPAVLTRIKVNCRLMQRIGA